MSLMFPPLFDGMALTGAADPFVKACTQAVMGCDAGLVTYNIAPDRLRAAIVFAPETPLDQALPVLVACEVGLQNALGALAPPEVSVHFTWPGDILINGARCGRMSLAAGPVDADGTSDWIVVGLDLPILPQSDDPGQSPDDTCLYEEGCAEVGPDKLLEAWTRHTLVWINRWSDEGPRPLNQEWRPLVDKIGDNVDFVINGTTYSGTFMGVDEDFNALLRRGDQPELIKLSSLLQQELTG